MRATWVSSVDAYRPGGRRKWRNFGGLAMLGSFCDWAHRFCDKTQRFLLPFLSQWRLCTESWSSRNFASLPRQQTISPRRTSEVGDTELGSWEVLDFEGKTMSPAEKERQREKIMTAPLVLRDREYPFSEDVLVDETGAMEPSLRFMAKVSSLIEVLRLGGSYALVYQLWVQ